VSALGTRSDNLGYLLVIDDLTELLQAQKASAWQEVARRIAHENQESTHPDSAFRATHAALSRSRSRQFGSRWVCIFRISALVAECSHLIEQEAGALASLVDEFSQFVRFPSARLEPADANSIVTNAIQLFHGRMEGIALRLDLSPALPPIRADAELLSVLSSTW